MLVCKVTKMAGQTETPGVLFTMNIVTHTQQISLCSQDNLAQQMEIEDSTVEGQEAKPAPKFVFPYHSL